MNTQATNAPPAMSAYLIQRLTRKPESDFMAKLSQVFGGGMLGLSADGWKVCQSVFDFDYMGAAEYEFGAISAAMRQVIANRADYRCWSFVIPSAKIEPAWWRKFGLRDLRDAEVRVAKDKGEKPPRMTPKHKRELEAKIAAPPTDKTIYVVSPHLREQVEDMILRCSRGLLHTKESPRFDLDKKPESASRETIGWFDLNNEQFWFTDAQVYEGFVKVFGFNEEKKR